MKRVLLIALAILMVLAPIARAEGQEAPMAEAQKSFQPFEPDGEEAKIGGYLINANNYYKLRDLAALLNGTDKQFNIVFDDVKKQIALELGKPYEKLDTDLQEMKHDKTKAKMVTNTILVDGKEVELKAALIDRNNYVKLRDLGAVVGFNVAYNKETQAIIVDTKSEAKAEEKAEEKTKEKSEDKKEEKSEDKKPEEKKVEKKDQVKNADPNATIEEIKEFLADKKRVGDLSFEDFILGDIRLDELKVSIEDGVTCLVLEGDGVELLFPVSRYELLDKEANNKKIAEQSEVFAKSELVEFYMGNHAKIYFLNAESFGQKSIDILSIVKDFGFITNTGKKVGLGIDKMTLLAPSVDKKNSRVIGTITVSANYSDGSKINSSGEKPLTEVPLFNGDKKAKLSNITILVTPSHDYEFPEKAYVYIR